MVAADRQDVTGDHGETLWTDDAEKAESSASASPGTGKSATSMKGDGISKRSGDWFGGLFGSTTDHTESSDGASDDHLPGETRRLYTIGTGGNPSYDAPRMRYSFASYTRSGELHEIDPATGKDTLLKRATVLGDFDLMRESGVYVAPAYSGNTDSIVLTDEWGPVNIYLLPFVKPVNVKHFFEEEQVENYTDALRVAVEQMKVNPDERNVIVTHQFVTGAKRSESEEISVGGTDNVDVNVFENFDYVALGHIHGPQKISRETVRYCGTPLKYSFSEIHHKKSVTIVEMKQKGNVVIRTKELNPLHDWYEIKGSYMEVAEKSYYDSLDRNCYMHITLTDEEDIPDAVRKLQVIYPNLMKLDYDNQRTRGRKSFADVQEVEEKTPFDIFEDLYEKQNNQEMNEEQKQLIHSLIEKIWEDKN